MPVAADKLDPIHSRVRRRDMVEKQIKARGVVDHATINALLEIPREHFIASQQESYAYDDCPLGIGHEQTISQPYMVAAMAAALALNNTETVLEVGAGSGYGAAILSRMARQVVAIERLPELLNIAQKRWQELGLDNIIPVVGDGSLGWPDLAPYDAISVTAAAPKMPQTLIEQLKKKYGRMVLPLGDRFVQTLTTISRSADGSPILKPLFQCTFVPLIGKEGW